MRPSLANGVQAWSIDDERSGIAPGACATTGPLAHIANTTLVKSHAALRIRDVLQTDLRATTKPIASSLGRFRSVRISSCSWFSDDTRGVEPRRDAWTAPSTPDALCHTASAPQSQLRSPGASRPVRATYSV